MKFGFAVCAALLAASPAVAMTDANPFSADTAVLDLSGINLASVDGQERLAIRMDRVASKVCGERLGTIHLALDAQARGCRADVTADIRARVAAATAARQPARATQLAAR